VCRCFLVNLFGAGRPVARSTGMVLGNGVRPARRERHQTAFRGRAAPLAGGAAAAYKARRLRNLSVPTGRSLKTHGSIPRGGGDPGRRCAGELRPLSLVAPAPSRIGFVRQRLARRAAAVDHAAPRRRWNSTRLISPSPPVTGPGANPNAMGSGVCRSTTGEVEPQEPVVRSRSPMVPQFGRTAPRAGPVVAHHPSRTVHAFFLFARGFWSSTQPFKKRLRSNGTCWRHRW